MGAVGGAAATGDAAGSSPNQRVEAGEGSVTRGDSQGARPPAKYLNSPETCLFKKGKNVFGLDLAKQVSLIGRSTSGFTCPPTHTNVPGTCHMAGMTESRWVRR